MLAKKDSAAKKIVVIDDEVSVGETIRDFLIDEGYEAFVASEAKKGLELVVQEKPELVLLDLLMPQIGGIEVLKRIKEVRPETFVVVISGLTDEEIAKQAIRRGAFDYVTKPFDLVELKEKILDRVFLSDAP